MGMTHYSILNSNPKLEFVGICDPSSFIRKNAEKYLHVESFEGHEEMLDRTSPDFVIVSTPTGLHADCAIAAINRGTHVFMEKPLSVSVDDGRAILGALAAKPVVNQVGYVVRFNDIFLAVKKLVDSGALGDILSFKAEVRGPTILHDVKQGWRATTKEGGGCLHDFASHAVDLICHLFGPPDTVSGSVLQRIHSSQVDDAVYSTLTYKNGAVGSLLANWSDPAYRKPTYNFTIQGRSGKIIADLHEFKVFFRDAPADSRYQQGWNTIYVTDIAEPVRVYLRGYEFTRQLDYFVDQVAAGSMDNICTFEDAFQTDRVIERIASDAERGATSHG